MLGFVETWKRAKAAGVVLPATEDPDYASLDALLRHLLLASRGYITAICAQLDLPDPDIRAVPETSDLESALDDYLAHLLERWRSPLAALKSESLGQPEWRMSWKTMYCADSLLEHAVMHPIRHAFQLEELIASE